MLHQPVQMLVVSLLFSCLLIAGVLFYYFIYPKKKINPLVLLILISLLPLISILRQGSYESGDLSLHTKFAIQFFDNLKEGHIVPAWIESHCSGYGCPVYIFMFMLPYYLVALFHLLGASFLFSMKLLMIFSFIFSGIGMYFWMKDEFGEKPGFIAAIFYLFAPYHLIDLSFRVSIGELVSMAILPFLFLTARRYLLTRHSRYFISNALLLGLLVLAHQVTSFICFPLLILYSLFIWVKIKKRSLQALIMQFVSFLFGILLVSFYWIPILVEGKLTKYGHGIDIEFHPISSFLYSPNRFGLLFQGHNGELYFNVGYVQWLIIAVSIYLFWKKLVKGKDREILGGVLFLFIVFFVMMQSISRPIWEVTPIIEGFQFAWRIMIEITIFVSIMAAIIIKRFPSKKLLIVLTFITVGYTILNWGNRKVIPTVNDTVLRNEPVFTEKIGKWGIDFTSPIWVDEYKPWIGIVPKAHLEILSGRADIKEISRQITHHEYLVSASTDTQLKENTYYYPGWEISVNNNPVPINYQTKDYPGVMTFSVPKGVSKVDVIFEETLDRKIGKIISGVTGAIFFLYIFYLLTVNKYFQLSRFIPKR